MTRVIYSVHENYRKTLEKCKNIASIWLNRSLSIIGKVLVVNTLLYSQFLHKLQALPNPDDDVYKKFNEIVTNFIWEGKRAKISITRLQQTYENAGLKLINLRHKATSIKFAAYVRYAKEDNVNICTKLMCKAFKMPQSMLLTNNIRQGDIPKYVPRLTCGLHGQKFIIITLCQKTI